MTKVYANGSSLIIGSLLCLRFAANGWAQESVSVIKSDERVLFFPTSAHLNEQTQEWTMPIHGWIFEPEENDLLRSRIINKLLERSGLTPGNVEAQRLESRLRPFLVDNERAKRIQIRSGDDTFSLSHSGSDGHFRDVIHLTADKVRRHSQDHTLTFTAITRSRDERIFHGVVRVIEPTGISVISDIDDTIKITQATDPRMAVENTFFHAFQPVKGMSELYQHWAGDGAAFHYVSLSMWQLYEPLNEFLIEHGFPGGTIQLSRLRGKEINTLRDLIAPNGIKQSVIEPLLKQYPRRQFILVGDSGQQDPEIYGQIARTYPQQILAIYIHNVTNEAADSIRFAAAFKDLPSEHCHVFSDAGLLIRELPKVR